jgi:cytochrome b6-f complex iron-sulfur subunit
MAGPVSLVKSIFGICETKPLSPDLWSREANRVRVKVGQVPELSREGDAVYLKGESLEKPLLVLKTGGDQYLAFANRCTHVGHRKLDPVPGQRTLRCCSIGHSTFDYEGKRLSGLAKDALTRHETEMSEGDLLIKL